MTELSEKQQEQPQIDWETFCQEVQKHPKKHISVWRGERNPSWKLEATFQRNVIKYLPDLDEDSKHEKIFELRDRLFHKFKLAMRGMRGSNPASLSYNQVWALGRHFGLNTPFLDWSSSPFIAAAFAVLSNMEAWLKPIDGDEDGVKDSRGRQIFSKEIPSLKKIRFAVYQLILKKEFFKILKEESNDFKVVKDKFDLRHQSFLNDITKNKEQLLRVFQSPQNSNKQEKDLLLFLDVSVEELKRMQGQRGYFTMLHSAKHSDLEDFLQNNGGEFLIRKYIIEDHLDKIVEHLVFHANDLQVLYPDLEGAAKQANLMLLVDTYHDIRE